MDHGVGSAGLVATIGWPFDAWSWIWGCASSGVGVAAAWVEGEDLALRFDLRTREATAVATPVSVGAVNKHGVLGGTRTDTDGPGLVSGEKTMDLPALVDGGAGRVATISSSGQPAGTVDRAGGTRAAVTWTCR